MREALILVRLVQFAAAMSAFGAAAFRLYALAGIADAGALASFDRRFGRLILAAALVALGSALAIVPLTAAGMAGTPAAAIDPATVTAVLSDTAFGRVWRFHLAAAVLLTLAAAARYDGVALVLALLTLASLAFVGHAADPPGWVGLGHELNQCLHLIAAGLWLGGLLPLDRLLHRAGRTADERLIEAVRRAVPAFSHMGYAAVALLAITGAVNTAILVGSVGELFDTAYGRLLSLKIALYLAMVAVAAANRFRLAPRLVRPGEDAAASAAALHRAVIAEQILGIAVLAAVSALGTWPPPMR